VLSWAQLIYVVSGLSQLLLVFSLLGIVSWLPRDLPPGHLRPCRFGLSGQPL
jgi:hypothetical protein